MTDVANLFKAAAKTTRADVVAMRTALETAFDPAVRDMEDGAWESDAATAWYQELTYHRDAVFGAVGLALDDLEDLIAREDDEVPADHPHAFPPS